MTQKESTYIVNLKTTPTIINYLISKDKTFEFLFSKFGYAKIERVSNLFESIVSNIIGQQLSNKVK